MTLSPESAAERVLCITAAAVDRLGPPPPGGFSPDWEAYYSLLKHPKLCRFIPRRECEDNSACRQVVPYTFLDHDGLILAYERGSKGGEARLHRRISIGVGGHVNDNDLPGGELISSNIDFRFAELEGMWRELYEEVHFGEQDLGDMTPFGVIDSRTSAVDCVHLGFVRRLRVNTRDIRMRDGSPSFWATPAELLAGDHDDGGPEGGGRQLESWSRIVLRELAGQPTP